MSNLLGRVYKASLCFLEALTLPETYRIIVEEAIKLVGAERGTISLKDGRLVKMVYASAPELGNIQFRAKGYRLRAFRGKKILVINATEAIKVHPQLKKLNIRQVVFIPLFNHSRSVGILGLQFNKRAPLSRSELGALRLFGSLASLAIRKTQLYDELVKALETRDLFISLASHELRTPLTSILGYTDLLFNKLKDKKGVEGKWSQMLLRETVRFNKLVQELLKLNQIKTGKFKYDFSHVNLKHVVDRVYNDLKLTHPERQIKLVDKIPDGMDIVIGDFDKLVQVVINLVDNAIKFSDQDKPVEIILKVEKKQLLLAVRDYGHGMEKEEVPHLFEGFYKGKNNYKEGMGLGLFLTKSIINEHHGKIKVTSKPHSGTLMEVRLPMVI